MRRALWIALTGFGALAALVALGPREGVDRRIDFDAKVLGDDPDLWLQISEQQFPDIRPGAAKRILWARGKGVRTPLAVVYVHGFSASAEEIRPVPDEVARALGANLYFTRLAGHGRTPEAMAEPAAGDWIEDMAEAMAVGRSIGDRVLVIGTSTGGTLAALAATDPELSRAMAGVVLISPNFRLRPWSAHLLDLPFVRLWGPLMAGRTAGFEPLNAGHARYWTTSYPTAALFPMAAMMRAARAADYAAATMPLLVFYAPADQVIDTDAIAPVIATWGGPVEVEERRMTADDDPYAHVLAGDVLSPGQTEAVIGLILNWAARL